MRKFKSTKTNADVYLLKFKAESGFIRIRSPVDRVPSFGLIWKVKFVLEKAQESNSYSGKYSYKEAIDLIVLNSLILSWPVSYDRTPINENGLFDYRCDQSPMIEVIN